jgi:hypothetical protein
MEMIEYRAGTGQPPGTVEPAVPPAVRAAVRVMYAGAVAAVIHAVVVVVTAGAMKTALQQKHPHLSAGTLSTLTTITVVATAVLSLLGAVLFIWIARAGGRGKSPARITAAVLAALGALVLVYDVSNGRGTASLIVGFVVEAIGLASVAFLWLPSSSAYFQYFKRPQL